MPSKFQATGSLGVIVHRTNEEYPMLQTNHCSSYPSLDAQTTDKPGLDDNVEERDGQK